MMELLVRYAWVAEHHYCSLTGEKPTRSPGAEARAPHRAAGARHFVPMPAPHVFFQRGVSPPKPPLPHQLSADIRGPWRVPSWILPSAVFDKKKNLSIPSQRPQAVLSPPALSSTATFALGLLSPSSTPRSCHHTLSSASVTRHNTQPTHDISVEPIWMAW